MTERRFDLDWLRIGAFTLLIGYHVGMLYVPWAFHLKSAYRGEAWLTALMLALNPWRLSLLFVIAGCATGFMAQGLGRGALARERTRRLLIPLVFGMVVVVVPQVYFEVVQRRGYGEGFVAFWGRYLAFDQTFGTPVPTWNHLWFVAYLLLYTLVAAVLMPRGPAAAAAPRRPSTRALAVLLVGPWLWLWALRVTLFPVFGSTHAMWGDVYNHALYGSMFAFGLLLVRRTALWVAIDRLRWPALGLAVLGGTVFIAWALAGGDASPAWGWQRIAASAGREAQAWGAVLAALGFGHRLLNRDHPTRAYLAEAVFAYYIVHQTALIALAAWLAPLRLGGALEAGGVIAGTVLACGVGAEVARRVAWLRPLFGFRPSGVRRMVPGRAESPMSG